MIHVYGSLLPYCLFFHVVLALCHSCLGKFEKLLMVICNYCMHCVLTRLEGNMYLYQLRKLTYWKIYWHNSLIVSDCSYLWIENSHAQHVGYVRFITGIQSVIDCQLKMGKRQPNTRCRAHSILISLSSSYHFHCKEHQLHKTKLFSSKGTTELYIITPVYK